MSGRRARGLKKVVMEKWQANGAITLWICTCRCAFFISAPSDGIVSSLLLHPSIGVVVVLNRCWLFPLALPGVRVLLSTREKDHIFCIQRDAMLCFGCNIFILQSQSAELRLLAGPLNRHRRIPFILFEYTYISGLLWILMKDQNSAHSVDQRLPRE